MEPQQSSPAGIGASATERVAAFSDGVIARPTKGGAVGGVRLELT